MTHERIEMNPEIMGGKPVIRGTRVPVEIVLRKLGAGMTAEAIVGDHPRLTLEDIRAAQAFAADYLADEALVYGQASVRWLVDECVDAALVALLRESGHDAVYMSDVAPRATDVEVMIRADRDSRLLLTEDKDFGDLVFRQARPVPGIVLLRIDSARRAHKGARLLAAIDRFGDNLLGRYTVIEDARFRSRPLRLT